MKRNNLLGLIFTGFLFIVFVGGCQLAQTSENANANVFLADVNNLAFYKNASLVTHHAIAEMSSITEAPEVVGMLVGPLSEHTKKEILNVLGGEKYKKIRLLSFNTHSAFKNYFEEIFPHAEIQTLTVNSERQARQIATELAATLPPESLVVVESEVEFSKDPLLLQFQKNFYFDVLSQFETAKFDDLPQRIHFPLQALDLYLKARNLENFTLEPLQTGNNYFSACIKKSEAMGGSVHSRSAYLVFFGDIMLDRDVRNLMNKNGLDHPFQKMDLKYLKMNDFLVANLEGPIAKNAIKTSKTIAFRFMPDTAPLLKKYFFDVLSLANNHAMDMSAGGYDSSRELLKAENIIPFGDPRKVTDESVAMLTVGGQKIALLGLEEVVYKIEDDKAVAKIKELTDQGYKVIVFPHWGIEYTHEPNKRQKDLAHKFIDAGAVAVIGHHPHVVQAFENYNGRPIFYSLGNAIFDQYFSADTQEGLSLAMEINDGKMVFSLLPIKIDRTQMQLMNEEERKIFLEKFAGWGTHSEQEKQMVQSGKIFITQM